MYYCSKEFSYYINWVFTNFGGEESILTACLTPINQYQLEVVLFIGFKVSDFET